LGKRRPDEPKPAKSGKAVEPKTNGTIKVTAATAATMPPG